MLQSIIVYIIAANVQQNKKMSFASLVIRGHDVNGYRYWHENNGTTEWL